jgi:hypothetical protein
MSIITIVVVGLIATLYMSGAQLAAARTGFVKSDMIEIVGNFLIPEPLRSRALAFFLHLLAGVVFTFVYAYLFSFPELRTIRAYAELGALIGFVHGFLVSYFTVMGLSGYEDEAEASRSERSPSTFAGVAANVASHLIFGTLVGLGLGFAQLTGTVWYFAAYAALLGAAAAGFYRLVARRPEAPLSASPRAR